MIMREGGGNEGGAGKMRDGGDDEGRWEDEGGPGGMEGVVRGGSGGSRGRYTCVCRCRGK